jgi:hypothetical protein
MRTNISRAIISIGVFLAAFAVGSVALGLNGVSAPEMTPVAFVPAPKPDHIEPVRNVIPAQTKAPELTLPDLSGVDFGKLAILLEEKRREEARQRYGKCGEWRELALQIGWPAEEWPTLSHVLYRESRCNIGSHNKTDPASGSRGLMQINGYWCRPSKWTQSGWLQDRGVLQTCEDLFQPEINFKAGLAIWQYGEEKHGCGWRGPWATPCGKFG